MLQINLLLIDIYHIGKIYIGHTLAQYKNELLMRTDFENLYSPEIHPVGNNMREHREKLN